MTNDRMTNSPEDNPNHAGLFVIGHFESGGRTWGAWRSHSVKLVGLATLLSLTFADQHKRSPDVRMRISFLDFNLRPTQCGSIAGTLFYTAVKCLHELGGVEIVDNP